jgi:hypothetical protein
MKNKIILLFIALFIFNNISICQIVTSPDYSSDISRTTRKIVGLDNVNNTSDLNKPISIATQLSLDNLLQIINNKSDLTGSSLFSKLDKVGGTISGNLGIGVSSPVSKLQVNTGDVELGTIGNGVIITSPNGARWRITINNTGNLTTTSL